MSIRFFARCAAPLAIAVFAGCAATPPRNPLALWVPSANHEARRPVLVVIHATEQASAAESLDTLRRAHGTGRVSAHYLVGRDGALYQLVADERRAWHAGGGRWGTITDVNSSSIGIELDNDGGAPFPEAQIAALVALLDDLCTRLDIPRTQVIAHADLAPTRKRDPSARFPWSALADAGFGAWPPAAATAADAVPPPGFDPHFALAAFGYAVADRAAAIRAFRRHYRGIETDPTVPGHDATLAPDALDEVDARILFALTRHMH